MAMYARHGFGLWHATRSRWRGGGMCACSSGRTAHVDVGYAFFPAYWGQGFAHGRPQATLSHRARKFGLERIIACFARNLHRSACSRS